MKIAFRYLIILGAVSFITYLAVAIGNWPEGHFDVVQIFTFTLGVFVGYLAFKLVRSNFLSLDKLEKKKSTSILVIKVLFSIGTLYLLLRYGALAILANGMMSFGSYSPMTAVEFFLMSIPFFISVCYGITAWKPLTVIVWPLRILAILLAGGFLFRTFGHPAAGDTAVFMNIYFTTWAFLTIGRKNRRIHQDGGINSVTAPPSLHDTP